MFGPDQLERSGIFGVDGEITGPAKALIAKMARWSIKRSGTNPPDAMHPQPYPRLRFKANFAWKSEVLMHMAARGEFKPRIRVFMVTTKGKEQVDVVNWDEWRLDEDGVLILENVLHFDTAPLGLVHGH